MPDQKISEIQSITRKPVDQRKIWLAVARGLKFTASQIEAALNEKD